MKIFLALSIGAMVSAGVYGVADMAIDLRNGTMISYDRGDHEPVVEPVTEPQNGNAQNVLSEAAKTQIGRPAINAVHIQPPPPDRSISAFFIDFTENYSRAAPETRTIEEVALLTELGFARPPSPAFPDLLTAGLAVDTLPDTGRPVIGDRETQRAPVDTAVAEVAEEESVAELFSRRPLRPKVVQQEATEEKNDSLKIDATKNDL
jgi:hypothetical protein